MSDLDHRLVRDQGKSLAKALEWALEVALSHSMTINLLLLPSRRMTTPWMTITLPRGCLQKITIRCLSLDRCQNRDLMFSMTMVARRLILMTLGLGPPLLCTPMISRRLFTPYSGTMRTARLR